MKKFIIFLLSCSFIYSSHAQIVTSLSETFNASCATTGTNYPLHWTEWNTLPPVNALAWTCTPAGGKDATPGIVCNSHIGGVHYLDTSWLFTPKLDLSGYDDSVYLRFDSRYDISGARMELLVNPNYDSGLNPMDTPVVMGWVDMATAERLAPVIGPDDSAGWVTHYVNLTAYKANPLYVAFRYVSTTTTGGAWTIDNVFLTPWGLGVNDLDKHSMKLSILGTSSTDKISFAAYYPNPGNYNVYLYDVMGREVHKSSFFTGSGNNSHSVSGLSLMPGIYFLKVGDIKNYAVTSTIIQ